MPSIGLDHRSSSGYVTDPAGHYFAQPDFWAPNYPITLGGVNTGWYTTGGVESYDESSSVDARLAGTVQSKTATDRSWHRVDWTAGNINFRGAFGDAVYTSGDHYVELYDGATSLGVIVDVGAISAGHFIDAAGTDHASAAAWVSSNASIPLTLPTGVFYVVIGRGASATAKTPLNHYFIEDAGGGDDYFPVYFSKHKSMPQALLAR